MSNKALLIVSFGTTYLDALEKCIASTENALALTFSDYSVKRAFSSEKVIKVFKERDGIVVDNPAQAMEKIFQSGYSEVMVQPLHVIGGIEYEKILLAMAPYKRKFTRLSIGYPLLTDDVDFKAVMRAISSEIPKLGSDEAVVLMGHGSNHQANNVYSTLDKCFKDHGYSQFHIATVEGVPLLASIIPELQASKIRKVTLMPLMLVVGDHARNDMAGDDEESWKSVLEREGFSVEIHMVGLGEMKSIHQVYSSHIHAALDNEAI